MDKKFARIKLVNIGIYLFIMQLFCVNETNHRALSCAADQFADGCSVPPEFPAPFKKEFTSACNQHDICYGCVSIEILVYVSISSFNEIFYIDIKNVQPTS